MLRPRDWKVRYKLGAVLVIPAVALVFVASLLTTSSVRQATAFSELADQVALGEQVAALVHELQYERDRLGGELAAVAAAPAEARDRAALVGSLAPARSGVREARAEFDRVASPLRGRPALRAPLAEATAALDELAAVHVGVEEGWLRQRAASEGYTRAIEALHALLRVPGPGAAPGLPVPGFAVGVDRSLGTPGLGTYHDLADFKELGARIRGQVFAMASAGAVAPGMAEGLVDMRAQRTAALQRFQTSATANQLAQFDEVVRGQAVRGSARLELVVLEQATTGQITVDPEQWWLAATTELELVREVEVLLLTAGRVQARELSRNQWRATGLVTGVALAVLLVSLLASIGIGRSMATSLRRLREQAMEVAQDQLPGLLTRLRGKPGPVPEVADEVVPVTAGGTDEVGDVADAFTQVHRSAVELAVEQAAMRRNVNAIFVNLSRRSQLLVERQLELLDELEREETEPAQLRNLFRLDHLATRMRRNNESLLVLTAADTARPHYRPVPLTAVAVAAIAEIEQYDRVREGVAAGPHVVGRVVTDLVHLLAELLDNATTFSARDTVVTITGRELPQQAGALVEVTDAGMGMSAAAIAEANAVLAAPPAIDAASSERMGLVVVGHLATRHAIRVQLGSRARTQALRVPRWGQRDEDGAAGGVRASVWLPATLLAEPLTDPLTEPVTEPVTEPLAGPADRDGQPPIRMPLLLSLARDGGRAVRAEDVLAAELPAGTDRSGTEPDPLPARPAPPPAPAVAGTSTGGLPIRRPQAIPSEGRAARPVTGWTGDLDPVAVGSTLTSFYSGVRRAEAEEEGTGGEPEQGSA